MSEAPTPEQERARELARWLYEHLMQDWNADNRRAKIADALLAARQEGREEAHTFIARVAECGCFNSRKADDCPCIGCQARRLMSSAAPPQAAAAQGEPWRLWRGDAAYIEGKRAAFADVARMARDAAMDADLSASGAISEGEYDLLDGIRGEARALRIFADKIDALAAGKQEERQRTDSAPAQASATDSPGVAVEKPFNSVSRPGSSTPGPSALQCPGSSSGPSSAGNRDTPAGGASATSAVSSTEDAGSSPAQGSSPARDPAMVERARLFGKKHGWDMGEEGDEEASEWADFAASEVKRATAEVKDR